MPSYLIVGASRGLGYGWLQYLSQNPLNVVVGLARTPAAVEEQLAKDGIKNVHIISGDMTSYASLNSAAALASPLLPSGLDVLIVNGARIDPKTSFFNPTDFSSSSQAKVLHDDMHATLDTNVVGVMYSINAFLPLVLKGDQKKIVVISSGMADPDTSLDGVTVQVAYSSMKAAMNIIVAKYATELRPKGVMTLALCPGVVNTGALGTQPTEEVQKNMQALGEIFMKKYPHWKGPYTPMESVEYQMKVIDGLKIEDSGKFLSHKGDTNWL